MTKTTRGFGTKVNGEMAKKKEKGRERRKKERKKRRRQTRETDAVRIDTAMACSLRHIR